MNRQEVVIALAKINLMNKQVAYWIELEQDMDNISIALDLGVVPGWIDEILDFMKNNSCLPVVKFVSKMFSINLLKESLKKGKLIWKQRTFKMLSSFAGSIDKLYSTSSIYYKIYKQSPYGDLEDALSNDKGVELLRRAVNAGYLKSNYLPSKGTTLLELKAIAWGVGQALKIRWREQWVTFERQWKLDRIGNLPIPDNFDRQCKKIIELYPEVDYAPLSAVKEDAFFNKPRCESRIEELFLALVTYGYIDRKTMFNQFQRIFGIHTEKDYISEIKPVAWIKDQRSLTYFVYFAFGKQNHELWVKAQNCFVVNGRKPNKGSLKTGMIALKRDHPDIEQYDPCLLILAKQFNR